MLDMLDNTPTDRESEVDWYSVADHSAKPFELDGLTFGDEGIVSWKPLKQRSFTQRYPSRLSWVSEPAASEPEELRGEGWRGLVVSHAAVNGGIRLASPPPMTVCNQLLRPITPGTTGLRVMNTQIVQIRESGRGMQTVRPIGLSMF
jgi:hypothetical protein